jgi:hypothetical protein
MAKRGHIQFGKAVGSEPTGFRPGTRIVRGLLPTESASYRPFAWTAGRAESLGRGQSPAIEVVCAQVGTTVPSRGEEMNPDDQRLIEKVQALLNKEEARLHRVSKMLADIQARMS